MSPKRNDYSLAHFHMTVACARVIITNQHHIMASLIPTGAHHPLRRVVESQEPFLRQIDATLKQLAEESAAEEDVTIPPFLGKN